MLDRAIHQGFDTDLSHLCPNELSWYVRSEKVVTIIPIEFVLRNILGEGLRPADHSHHTSCFWSDEFAFPRLGFHDIWSYIVFNRREDLGLDNFAETASPSWISKRVDYGGF